MKVNISRERSEYLKKLKKESIYVKILQAAILVLLIAVWQILADLGKIDTFITSSPKEIALSLKNLFISGQLLNNVFVSMYETLIGFTLGLLIGTICAVMLWWFPMVSKVMDVYLTVLNALPKVALGPVIIIWAGAGMKSIIIMALLISTISTIIGLYTGFKETDYTTINLVKTFGANKLQILFKVLLPSSCANFISMTKINIGLSWVGVIMGEFLVSKEGIGYLIMYGSQVFNLTLVMVGIILVCILASSMYFMIFLIEKALKKKFDF